jgi:hypothetical protein
MPEIKRHSSLAELADWNDAITALAARAERLAAAPAARVSVNERADLAGEAFRLLWLSLSPAVVAASCRASALLGEPLLCSVPVVEEQMLALHRLRAAGVLGQPDELGGEVEADQPAEPEPEPAELLNVQHVGHLDGVDDAEPEAAEAAEVDDDAHQGDEPQEIEAQPATEQLLTRPQLAELLGVSDGTVRSWISRGWLSAGQPWVTDPSNRRRLLYNPEACREVVAQRSRKLRGLAAQTPEGAEERRLLRVQRQNARRERARQNKAQAEAEVEPVEQGGESEPAAGSRLEQLLSALLMEVRGSGG